MSKDTKLFTIAGTSTFRGNNTYRFCNGKVRTRELVLKRNGHLDINLTALPTPMTKADAIAYLQGEGVAAVMPKTGRGSGITLEQYEAQQKLAEARVEAEKTAEVNIADADAAFLENLGK